MRDKVSKLDLFAMNALPEAIKIVNKPHLQKQMEHQHCRVEVAKLAYDLAEAMIIVSEERIKGSVTRIKNPPLFPVSRCCGRCDGLNNECVSDMICEKHFQQGCEICFGER